jgi:ADP-ribosylglycohydrolase
MSVRAAVTAIAQSRGMSELLRRCVAFTGDVDTVAAIALGAGSLSREVEQDLPDVLYAKLEDGPFGYRYLRELDQRLAERFPTGA